MQISQHNKEDQNQSCLPLLTATFWTLEIKLSRMVAKVALSVFIGIMMYKRLHLCIFDYFILIEIQWSGKKTKKFSNKNNWTETDCIYNKGFAIKYNRLDTTPIHQMPKKM